MAASFAMSAPKNSMEKVASPATFIEPSLLQQIEEERCIIVHCKILSYGGFVRVWKSTFLIEQNGTSRANLLFALDICVAPEWCYLEKEDGFSYFTLIFETLPKRVSAFVLQEVIPEPGGFISPLIQRNQTDVYQTILTCKI
jgi:hypothetical protein